MSLLGWITGLLRLLCNSVYLLLSLVWFLPSLKVMAQQLLYYLLILLFAAIKLLLAADNDSEGPGLVVTARPGESIDGFCK